MGEIELEPDPIFEERFERVREDVEAAAVEGLLGVFHVGSTAVPDLAAKPVVDVLAVFDGYEPARETAAELAAGDYRLRKDTPEWIQVVRGDGTEGVFVHFRPRDADAWRDQLLLREYLRDSEAARREYERVKRAAADAHPDDPEAYTAAKDDVIRRLEERAHEAGYDERIPDLDW